MSVDELLPYLEKPSRYLGCEYNVIHKDWDSVSFRAVLAFPDLYEIGMSHHGLQILYHILNRQRDFLAERVYAPDQDLEKLLREKGEPLFALESGRPVGDFDMLGITLPYELCYSNILTILDLAGIPFQSAERSKDHPFVIGGGPCAFHPEPLADYFDAFLLGDGEEAVISIAKTIQAARKRGSSRQQTLLELSEITGVYVPSLFVPHYDGDGEFTGVTATRSGYESVRRAILPAFERDSFYDRPLVPQTRIVHDRLGIELARGCTRGCRFCQAGVIYRPVRERHPADILEIAKRGIRNGGFDELALLSLSTGDYSCLAPLLVDLMNYFTTHHVSVSMPSMRVGTLTPEIMEQIQRVRKSGFTIAPEAGSERLRQIINKGITESDLLETVTAAFALGWKTIKLYFMVGLPFETDDDVAAIPELVRKAKAAAGRGGNINVSVGTFVPKPHTPFQWSGQMGVAESFKKFDAIKYNLPKGARLKWNDPRLSYLEGVLARGDRRIGAVIERAWRLGARLDAWSEYFDLPLWQKAAAELDIDLEYYLAPKDIDAPLPWQHLSAGVAESFYKDELAKAAQLVYTPDCRVHGCQKCGLCDFKTVRPITYASDAYAGSAPKTMTAEHTIPAGEGSYHYWVDYQRIGKARYFGHLELLQTIFRALQRAGIDMRFSQGFNPSPKVSFSPALSVGTESYAEYFVVETARPLRDLGHCLQELNDQMPPGLKVTNVRLGPKTVPVVVETDYRILMSRPLESERITQFLAAESYLIQVVRKKKQKIIDVRPDVSGLSLESERTLLFTLKTEAGKAGVKPMEIARELFSLTEQELYDSRLTKLGYRIP